MEDITGAESGVDPYPRKPGEAVLSMFLVILIELRVRLLVGAEVSLVDTETAESFPLAEEIEAEEETEETGAAEAKFVAALTIGFSFLDASILLTVDFFIVEINPGEVLSFFSLLDLYPRPVR